MKSEKKWYGGHELKIKVHKTKQRPYVRVKYVDDSKDSGYDWKFEWLKGEPYSIACYKSLDELKEKLGATEPADRFIEEPKTPNGRPSDFTATVADVFEAYYNLKALQRDYQKELHKTYDSRKRSYFSVLIRTGRLLLPYAEMRADEFTSPVLNKMREYMIQMNLGSRKYINERVNKIKEIFKFARSKNMLSLETFGDLASLPPLTEQDQHVPGTKEVHVPSVEDVEAVIDAGCPMYRTILILASTTAIRSQNVCNIRWDEIDTSREETDGVWIYNPPVHKTDKVMDLSVVIGQRAITALKNYRDMAPATESGYIFSNRVVKAFENMHLPSEPINADVLKLVKLLDKGITRSDKLSAKLNDLRASLRRLRNLGWKIEGNRVRYRSEKDWRISGEYREYTVTQRTDLLPADRDWKTEYELLSDSLLNDHITNKNYNNALTKLCKNAGVKRFTAHKLRHFYTEQVCLKHSKAGAKAVVGHLTERMTEHYSRRRQDLNLAIEVQKSMG